MESGAVLKDRGQFGQRWQIMSATCVEYDVPLGDKSSLTRGGLHAFEVPVKRQFPAALARASRGFEMLRSKIDEEVGSRESARKLDLSCNSQTHRRTLESRRVASLPAEIQHRRYRQSARKEMDARIQLQAGSGQALQKHQLRQPAGLIAHVQPRVLADLECSVGGCRMACQHRA